MSRMAVAVLAVDESLRALVAELERLDIPSFTEDDDPS